MASFFENWIEENSSPLQDLASPRLAVDAGAHIGCYSLLLHSLYPECEIVALEPNAANAQLLQKNFVGNSVRGKVVEAALWHEPADSLFMIEGASNEGYASKTASGSIGNYEVAGKTLADILGSSQEHLDHLKLDIEGAEYDVLPKLLDQLPAKCIIWVEIHNVNERPGWTSSLAAEYQWRGQLRTSYPPHEMWLLTR